VRTAHCPEIAAAGLLPHRKTVQNDDFVAARSRAVRMRQQTA
jgi:hypothetical protein